MRHSLAAAANFDRCWRLFVLMRCCGCAKVLSFASVRSECLSATTGGPEAALLSPEKKRTAATKGCKPWL